MYEKLKQAILQLDIPAFSALLASPDFEKYQYYQWLSLVDPEHNDTLLNFIIDREEDAQTVTIAERFLELIENNIETPIAAELVAVREIWRFSGSRQIFDEVMNKVPANARRHINLMVDSFTTHRSYDTPPIPRKRMAPDDHPEQRYSKLLAGSQGFKFNPPQDDDMPGIEFSTESPPTFGYGR